MKLKNHVTPLVQKASQHDFHSRPILLWVFLIDVLAQLAKLPDMITAHLSVKYVMTYWCL